MYLRLLVELCFALLQLINHYEYTNERSMIYKKACDSTYQKFANITENGEQYELLTEYLNICKEVGSYIKDYILKQEINSIEDYIFLTNKIISIRSVMNNSMFTPKTTAISHTLGEMFNTGSSTSALIGYMEKNKDIEEMKKDIKGLRNVEKYIKSILV